MAQDQVSVGVPPAAAPEPPLAGGGPPDIMSKITAARDAGYTDEDIGTYLMTAPEYQPFVEEARKNGFQPQDIFDHFGLNIGPHWNGEDAAANGYLMGIAPRVKAAGAAAKEAYREYESGVPLGDALRNSFDSPNSAFDQAYEAYSGARSRYGAEHPVLSTGLELAGGAVPLALGAGELTEGLRALPVIGKFASGGAGLLSTGERAPGVGNLLLRMGSQGTHGALVGGASGAATSSMGEGSTGEQTTRGGEIGGALGLLGPGATMVGNKLAPVLSPQMTALANWAREHGVPLALKDITANPAVKQFSDFIDSLPFSGAAKFNKTQKSALVRAMGKTFGLDTDNLSMDAIKQRQGELGQTMDALAAKHGVPLDPAFHDDIQDILNRAASLPDADYRTVERLANDSAYTKQALTGEEYQKHTSMKSPLGDALQNADGNIRFYAGLIRNALDKAMERGAIEAGDMSIPGQIADVRRQYKNLMTVKGIVAKSGVYEPDPAKLFGPVLRRYGDTGNAGDLGMIANLGKVTADKDKFINRLTGRMLTHLGVSILPEAIGGALAYGDYLNPVTAAKLGAVGLTNLIAPRVIGGYLRRPGPVNQLIDQSMGRAPLMPGFSPAVPALAGSAVNR